MPQDAALEAFCAFFSKLDKYCTNSLYDVYTQDVVFIDPLHRIEGARALEAYFAGMYENVSHCHFDYHGKHRDGDTAFVTWTMHFAHPKLNSGRDISVDGCTRLQFSADGRVARHRDYFDAGAMLYEQVPLLGRVIRGLKRRAAR
ncbi:MAG: nuclear transport factor 2 family protein [Halomonas sp.]|nr:nuclear transport factor 2 family protein [Halomonas sp.]MDN6296875.1 nuclear transport factor 2 family protein [Halomonas sp.]MDN6314407.1 nuclear transport factor 2 family protein [Halomonas sp.]MDN6335633.1 nuclear transport factor 2 family protein [Halomonas sp.]